MNEAELRDIIANNIEILEPGLVLLNKEKFIPNSLGKNGVRVLYPKGCKGWSKK